jgi:MFS family permease
VAAFVRHALRARKPLLDIRLFASRAFTSAAATNFCLGGALFGAMILLPLYFQTIRGESAVRTGLLLAFQGVGMSVAMPLAGRLTDRFGGGILAACGVAITALATLPFAFVDEHTSYTLICGSLVARGFGIGMAFMPAMAAAYAVLRPDQVIDATPQLNVIQRVGGSIGTAIFAVVLSRDLRRADGVHGAAAAYASTYWWVLAVTAVAVVPAIVLARVERVRRRRTSAAVAVEAAA